MLISIEQQQYSGYRDKPNDYDHRKYRTADGHFNGFPVYYHDLTRNKTYHSRPYSSVRCVGENYQGDDFSWMHRSCHFRFLCFNVSSREFEVYARPDDEIMQSIVSDRWPLIDITADVLPTPRDDEHRHNTGSDVSLASGVVQHPKNQHGESGSDRKSRLRAKSTCKWFPTVVKSSPPERYYALDEDVVFVPFHSLVEEEGLRHGEYSGVWDDLLPIFTLLNMFQLVTPDNQKEILPIRYILKNKNNFNSELTQAQSGQRSESEQNGLQRQMNHPFWHLMERSEKFGRDNGQRLEMGTTQFDAKLIPRSASPTWPQQSSMNHPLASGLVCAKDAVAGLGPHGMRKTKRKKSTENVLNTSGKGHLLWMFRRYCLRNLELLPTAGSRGSGKTDSTIRITFSTQACSVFSKEPGMHNSDQATYDTGVSASLDKAIRNSLLVCHESDSKIEATNGSDNDYPPRTSVSISKIELDNGSESTIKVTTRIERIVNTAVFVVTCREAVLAATMFLPRGASLIILYEPGNEDGNEMFDETMKNDHGRTVEKTSAKKSDCADYRDVLNNLSYLHIIWLPMGTSQAEENWSVLYGLVEHGIGIYKRSKEISVLDPRR